MQTTKIFKTASLLTALTIANLASAQTQFSNNWVGPTSGGDWNNGANWSLGLPPGADVNGVTNAIIGSGNIVSYGSPMSSLTGFGGLTNNGVLAVNASGFNCSSIVTPLNTVAPIVYLTNGSGVVTVTGNFSLVTNGTVTMIAGTSLTVGGTLGVESASSSHASGTSTFTNSGGTLNANSTTIGTTNGTGTGRLVISGGVNNLGNTTFGRYATGSASTLGTEGLIINGGVVTMTNLAGLAASYGTAYFTGGTVTNFGNVNLMGGTAGRYLRVVQAGGLFVVPDPGIIYESSSTVGAETARYQVTGGTNIVGGFYLGASNGTVAATVTFTVGSAGVVSVGSQGIATNGAVLDTISLNSGGMFGATANWTGSANMSIGTGVSPFTFQAAGLDGTPHNITLNNPLVGTGSLNKTGGGTLTLNAANTYPGSTLINGGTLALGPSGSLSSSPIIVGSGATFDVSGVTGGFVLNNNQTLSGFGGSVNGAVNAASGAIINPGSNTLSGTLTLLSSLTETNGGVINHFDLAGAPNPNNDFLSIAGDFNVGGTNSVDILGASLVSSTNYPVIHYGGNFNGNISNFVVTTAIGTLSNSAVAKTIYFIPQATLRGPTNTVWVGNPVNTNWDNEVSTNWLNASSGLLDFFVPSDSVQFTDLGASNSPVNIVGTVQPTTVLFNSQSNYVLASTSGGMIDGTASLTVLNTGTLTILTTNDYAGSTLVNGGTLAVSDIANSLLPSSIGAASSDPSTLILTNGGQLNYIGANSTSTDHGITLAGSGGQIGVANTTTLTLNNAFSGTGVLTKRGIGELRLNVDNTTSGGILVSNGSLFLASGNAAGTGGITNVDGTTLKITGSTTVPNVFNVSGTVTLDLNNTGNSTALDGSWVGNGTVNVINQKTNNITFTMGGNGNGGGSMANFSGTVACGTNSGFFRFNDGGGDFNNGSTNMTLDLGTGAATFQDRNGGVTIYLGSLRGGSGTFLSGRASGNSGTLTYSIGGNNGNSDYSGTIKDGNNATALQKVGTGTMTLRGQSTFTGSTTISNGVLALADAGSISCTNIIVNTGAFLVVTGRTDGRLPLAFPQILQGNGTIQGLLDATGGGTVSPGGGLRGVIGTLTVIGDIDLGPGTDWMKLNRAASPNSDRLVATGFIYHFGEDLIVTNIGAPLQVGDTFTLFTSSPSGFYTYNSMTLPGYYTWDTSQLNVNGSITVTGVLTHPSVTKADFSGLAGGSITLSATNGIPGTAVNILGSTNLALPLGSWTLVTNTTFDSNGNLANPGGGSVPFTFNVNTNLPLRFYLLQTLGY